jgi:uncharacterized protein with PQ loop repeat
MNFEILGTIASIMVLISFLMKSEKSIRTINIFGASLFVVYGIAINAFSVWFLNGALCIVHIFRLLNSHRNYVQVMQNQNNHILIYLDLILITWVMRIFHVI